MSTARGVILARTHFGHCLVLQILEGEEVNIYNTCDSRMYTLCK